MRKQKILKHPVDQVTMFQGKISLIFCYLWRNDGNGCAIARFNAQSFYDVVERVRPQIMVTMVVRPAPINSRLNVVARSPTPFGLGRNGCWPSRGSQLPRALPFIFSLRCPLNDRRRAAHSIYKIGRLFSLFLFSCPTLALLRLLILLLLLMSGNVHSNPGPIFPCSVCAGNVTWRGKSVQCCTCSKWVHLRCSQLSLSRFRALGSSHSWSCFPCRNTVTPSSHSSGMYISAVQSGPLY